MKVTMPSNGMMPKGEIAALRTAADKFIASARTWYAMQHLTRNPKALAAAERNPAARAA